jgi:hypothetical protein
VTPLTDDLEPLADPTVGFNRVALEVTLDIRVIVNEPSVGVFPLEEGLREIEFVVRAILHFLATGEYPPDAITTSDA